MAILIQHALMTFRLNPDVEFLEYKHCKTSNRLFESPIFTTAADVLLLNNINQPHKTECQQTNYRTYKLFQQSVCFFT